MVASGEYGRGVAVNEDDVDELADKLVAMPLDDFYDIVDADLRRTDDEPIDTVGKALRSRDVCERWYYALLRTKKKTEMTIAAKALDDTQSRIQLLNRPMPHEPRRGDVTDPEERWTAWKIERQLKADRERVVFLKWKSGAIRYLTSVEVRLTEAAYCRRTFFDGRLHDLLSEQRNQLSQRVRQLEEAIEHHHSAAVGNDGVDPSKANEQLWALLYD